MVKTAQITTKIVPKSTIPKSKGVNSHSSEENENFIREEYKKPINPIKINLSKKFYGVKTALDNLDEEFNFFKLKKYSIKKFFELYNTNFYESLIIPRELHIEFITKSIHYAFPNGYENYRMKEKRELQEELKEIQHQIDSVEKEHPFFKNGNFIMEDIHRNNPGELLRGGSVFYLQSARKRKCVSNQVYQNLKTKLRKNQEDINDQDLILFINRHTLSNIPTGPDINKTSDINIPISDINTYVNLGETSPA